MTQQLFADTNLTDILRKAPQARDTNPDFDLEKRSSCYIRGDDNLRHQFSASYYFEDIELTGLYYVAAQRFRSLVSRQVNNYERQYEANLSRPGIIPRAFYEMEQAQAILSEHRFRSRVPWLTPRPTRRIRYGPQYNLYDRSGLSISRDFSVKFSLDRFLAKLDTNPVRSNGYSGLPRHIPNIQPPDPPRMWTFRIRALVEPHPQTMLRSIGIGFRSSLHVRSMTFRFQARARHSLQDQNSQVTFGIQIA